MFAADAAARRRAKLAEQQERNRPPSTTVAGARSEQAAVELLLASGYRIVERNFRVKLGELDVIAADGDTLVFVEVRSRADDLHGSAIEAVGYRKQRQVARVAEMYLAMRRPTQRRVRFDVVAITGGKAELIRDAWRMTFR
ncbi:MAG: YraN family protein [Deltaproteobacteria bacterium]|nr:YraN family protein [Deltaproteobacteria bacterium]